MERWMNLFSIWLSPLVPRNTCYSTNKLKLLWYLCHLLICSNNVETQGYRKKIIAYWLLSFVLTINTCFWFDKTERVEEKLRFFKNSRILRTHPVCCVEELLILIYIYENRQHQEYRIIWLYNQMSINIDKN